MNTQHQTGRSTPAAKRNDEPATLASRGDLPVRVRGLLDNILRRAITYFDRGIPHALDELEASLLALAERAAGQSLVQLRFEALREVRLQRARVLPRFLRRLEAQLASVRAPQTHLHADVPEDPGSAALELVDASVLDESLAIQEIAGKAEIRNTRALYALAHRFGVLGASAALSSDRLPLGPAQLVAAFDDAIDVFDIGVETRVLAFRHFDSTTLLPLADFYDELNAYLIAQRVLANLRWSAPRPVRETEAVATAAAAAAAAAKQKSAPAAAPELAETDDDAVDDSNLFGTLRDLLSQRQGPQPEYAALKTNVVRAEPAQLQATLGILQRERQGDLGARSTDVRRDLKRELTTELRRANPSGGALELAGEDADTIDLVGMLFDAVNGELRETSGARQLLQHLHVPVLRVALDDKTFFTRRDHPARELLNTIAETGVRWIDEADTDTDLTSKMRMVVDHVSREFDGDIGVFERLLGDLSEHMRQIARRAEIVERRNIEAARGRDKLDNARDAAHVAVAAALQGRPVSARLRALLEHSWCDALALSALRSGSDSEEFRHRSEIAGELVRRESMPLAPEPDQAVVVEIDGGLRQVGVHASDVEAITGWLFPQAIAAFSQAESGSAAKPAHNPSAALVDQALQNTQRTATSAPAKRTAEALATPLNATEKETLARIRTLAFGTLFDFIQNQQGASVRRKLAWFSPVSGRCLFLSLRGVRAEDRTLDWLAREMTRGQAKVVVAESTSIIDRAWKKILDTLRRQALDAHRPPLAHATNDTLVFRTGRGK